MKLLWKKWLAVVVVSTAAIVVCAGQARAGFAVKIGSTTVNDGDPLDVNTNANFITVNIGTGAGQVNIPGVSGQVIAAFTNTPGDATGGLIDISYNLSAVGNTGNSNIVIYTSASGYTQPTIGGNPLTMEASLNGNGRLTYTITGNAYADPSNGLFTTPASGSSQEGPFSGSGSTSAYGVTNPSSFTRGAGAYSLTEKLVFNISAGASTSGDFQLTTIAVPVPAGLVLALTGVPCLGIGAWLRRRMKKPR